MTTRHLREWVCDNCGFTETHPLNNPTPKHWVGVKSNTAAPIGSMDHEGWSSDEICGTCWESVVDLLGNAAQADPLLEALLDEEEAIAQARVHPQVPGDDGGVDSIGAVVRRVVDAAHAVVDEWHFYSDVDGQCDGHLVSDDVADALVAAMAELRASRTESTKGES